MSAMPNEGRLRVGYVAGVHGIAGLLRVQLHDPDSEAVRVGAELVLVDADGHAMHHRVESADPVPGKAGRLRVRLAGIDDRTRAESLVRCAIEIDRDALPPLEEDEFYLADAIGLPVCRIASDGSPQDLGRVIGLVSNGPQDLFEVQWHDAGGQAHVWLVPVLPQFVRDVDAQRVVVDVPADFLPDAFEDES
jgi:16S rRNA processing protein RimM